MYKVHDIYKYFDTEAEVWDYIANHSNVNFVEDNTSHNGETVYRPEEGRLPIIHKYDGLIEMEREDDIVSLFYCDDEEEGDTL